MDIFPAIPDRSTEQLMEIIEAPHQWRPEVVEQAQKELMRRGISLTTQETRRKTRSKFQKRIDKIKARATYTALEKLMIVLFGPLLFIIAGDLFLFQTGEGFKKKNRQGVIYLLLGIAFWGLMFYIIYST